MGSERRETADPGNTGMTMNCLSYLNALIIFNTVVFLSKNASLIDLRKSIGYKSSYMLETPS